MKAKFSVLSNQFAVILVTLCLWLPALVSAQVPGIINYQGRVSVGGTNFNGTGQFKFALVNTPPGNTTYWSNGVNTVSLTVTKGLYSVLLGDTGLANMDTAIPATVFANPDVRLRVWFNDGVLGLQQLSPDQRLAAAGHALAAANAFTWLTVTGATQQAVANTGYVVTNNAAAVTITLPASPSVGDVVRVTGPGAGGWKIAQNSGQSVFGGGAILSLSGAIWVPQGPFATWQVLASSADGSKLVAGLYNNPIYTSTDSGVTWTPRTNVTSQAVASSADGTKLVAVVPMGQIYTSTDSGVTWTARESNRA